MGRVLVAVVMVGVGGTAGFVHAPGKPVEHRVVSGGRHGAGLPYQRPSEKEHMVLPLCFGVLAGVAAAMRAGMATRQYTAAKSIIGGTSPALTEGSPRNLSLPRYANRGLEESMAVTIEREVNNLKQEIRSMEAELSLYRKEYRARIFKEHRTRRTPGLSVAQLQDALTSLTGEEVTHDQADRLVGTSGHMGLDEFVDDELMNRFSSLQKEDLETSRRHERRALKHMRLKEMVQKRREHLAGLPRHNFDVSWPVRLLALFPYALPLVSVLMAFGPAAAYAYAPEVYTALQTVPRVLTDVWPWIHPLLLMAVGQLAVPRRNPELLRFNLNQAYVLDLLLLAGQALSGAVLLLSSSFASSEAYLPEALQPPTMPFCELILPLTVLMVGYSSASTLMGVLPSRIPWVSARAAESLGKCRPTFVGPAKERHCQERQASRKH